MGEAAQMQLRALFSDRSFREVPADAPWRSTDPSIAVVSPDGVLIPVHEGSTNIVGQYLATEATCSVTTYWAYGTRPGDFRGTVFQAAPGMYQYGRELDAEVEIVGSEYNGRLAKGPEFLFSGIEHGGFQLIARTPGFQSTRYVVADLSTKPAIYMTPESSMISETFEGNLCRENPIRKAFTLPNGGVFRILDYRQDFYSEGGDITWGIFLSDGTSPPVFGFRNTYQFSRGRQFELRVSTRDPRYACGHFAITYLRPAL